MIQLINGPYFDTERDKALEYAAWEFGKKTVRKWIDELESFSYRVSIQPESFPYVAELQDISPGVRGAIVMRNFKIIYLYDHAKDTVYVADLWDMRKTPSKLRSRWQHNQILPA